MDETKFCIEGRSISKMGGSDICVALNDISLAAFDRDVLVLFSIILRKLLDSIAMLIVTL